MSQLTPIRDPVFDLPERPGLLEKPFDYFRETTIPAITRHVQRASIPADPDFQMTEEFLKELTRDIDTSLIGLFAKADSQQEAYLIRQHALSIQEGRMRLAQRGMPGIVGTFAANMFDPAFLIPGAAAARIATIGSASARLSRLSQFGRSAAAYGASDGLVESYLATQDPERTATDVVLAATAGGLLGGLADTGAVNRSRAAMARANRDIRYAEALANGYTPEMIRDVPQLREFFSDQVDGRRGGVAGFFRDAFRGDTQFVDLPEASGVDDLLKTIDQSRYAQPTDIHAEWDGDGLADTLDFQAEAAEPIPGTPDLSVRVGDGETINVSGSDAPGFLTRFRISPDARVSGANVPDPIRYVGSAMFGTLSRVGKAGERVVLGESALTATHRIRTNIVAGYNRQTDRAYKAWRQANGKRAKGKISGADREEFNTAVFDAINRRGRIGSRYSNDDHINAAAEQAAAVFERVHRIARRHGVKGFDQFDSDAGYVPWLFSKRRLVDFEADRGSGSSADLIAQSLRSANPDLSRPKSVKLGKLIRDKILSDGTDQQRLWLNGAQMSDMFKYLRREFEGVADVTDDDIRDMVRLFKPDGTDGVNARARRRATMDRQNTFRVGDRPAKLSDLVENDISYLVNDYARGVIGDTGMTAVYRDFEQAYDLPVGSIDTYDDLKTALTKQLEAGGRDPRTDRIAEDRVKLLDFMADRIKGRPMQDLRDRPKVRAALEFLQAFNFARLSGRFGFASLPEMFRTVGTLNFGTVVKGVPEMGRIIKSVRAGEPMSTETLQFAERFGAAAGLTYDSHATMRYLGALDQGVQQSADQATFQLRRINRGLSTASGLPIITDISQRVSQSLIIDDVVRKATSGRPGTRPSLAYLDRIGVTPDQWDVMAAGIRKYAKPRTGQVGHKFKDLDIDGWMAEDMPSVNRLAVGSYRYATRTILQPEASDLPRFMQGTPGRTLFQFRSFSVAAHDKLTIDTIRSLREGDMTAASAGLATTAAASLVYVAQTHLESLGQDDPRAYLRERLSDDRIAMVALYRSGFVGVMPDIAESAVRLTTGYSPFMGARQTGLTLDPFRYNPTQDLVMNDMVGFFQGIGQSMVEGDTPVTRDNVQSFYELLPGHRLPGVLEALQSLSDSFPEPSE